MDIKYRILNEAYSAVAKIYTLGEINSKEIIRLKLFLRKWSFLFDKKMKNHFDDLILKLIQKSSNERRLNNPRNFPPGNYRDWLCEKGYSLTSWFNVEHDKILVKYKHF